METAFGVAFLIMTSVLIVLVVLAMIRTGFAQLESAIGIRRDGLSPGTKAPPWSLPDLDGHVHMTPATDRWQFLIFADHSLASLPGVVSGINQLVDDPELEVLVLSRASPEICAAAARALQLQTPIVPVDQSFYNLYRVRVMPFAILLESQGITRWASLVNTDEQLTHAWRTIRALAEVDNSAVGARQ